ncbi:hypothetical protein ACOMHN_052610 [Nucella lapillus]
MSYRSKRRASMTPRKRRGVLLSTCDCGLISYMDDGAEDKNMNWLFPLRLIEREGLAIASSTPFLINRRR